MQSIVPLALACLVGAALVLAFMFVATIGVS
jgi:hypothetical protein